MLTLRASESIQDPSSPPLRLSCRLRSWHESFSAGAERVLATREVRDFWHSVRQTYRMLVNVYEALQSRLLRRSAKQALIAELLTSALVVLDSYPVA